MRATFRPIQWSEPQTPPAARRSRWTFKASWQDTLDLLDRELRHLDATDCVVEADFREQDLRVDGMPRASARAPEFPGVRIAFESKHGPLVYATDAHAFWQHNVRAIALALEALRSVDRYGVTRRAEQYAGWRAIGTGHGTVTSKAAAARFLAQAADRPEEAAAIVLRDPTVRDRLFRIAAKRLHPDAGGSATEFQRLQEAMEVLTR